MFIGAIITNILSGNTWLPAINQLENLSGTLLITFFFVIFFAGGINEESGWRGFAQKRLQSKFNPLVSAILLWILMIIWHIPNDLLEQVEFRGKIIFVTAYNEYATRAFEINAQDYLIKPVSKERLSRVLQKLSSKFIEDDQAAIVTFNYEDRIMVEQKKSINFLKLDKLVCIRAERDYTLLLDCNGKEYLILESIGKWQKKLPDEHFVRVHRNAIINFNFIEKAEKTGNTALIFLKGISKPVRVSRGYYKMLRAKYFYK
jgi:DNA-binding LytR/AlgR family response regulator